MGCDIHSWVQWLEYPGDEATRTADYWVTWSGEMNWSRNYALFARLAGVRCYHEEGKQHAWGAPCPTAVVQPRGWPPGSGWQLEEAKANSDLHTPTWLTLEELKRAAEESSGPDVDATVAAMESFESRGFKTRIVIAFDN